jgi:hypothetical protein
MTMNEFGKSAFRALGNVMVKEFPIAHVTNNMATMAVNRTEIWSL